MFYTERYGPLGSVHEALRWIQDPEGGACSNATLLDYRQQKNRESRCVFEHKVAYQL